MNFKNKMAVNNGPILHQKIKLMLSIEKRLKNRFCMWKRKYKFNYQISDARKSRDTVAAPSLLEYLSSFLE